MYLYKFISSYNPFAVLTPHLLLPLLDHQHASLKVTDRFISIVYALPCLWKVHDFFILSGSIVVSFFSI